MGFGVHGIIIGENWEEMTPVSKHFSGASDFYSIGHAGGFRGADLENKPEGFQLSRELGIQLFELDIFEQDGVLYCEHQLLKMFLNPVNWQIILFRRTKKFGFH